MGMSQGLAKHLDYEGLVARDVAPHETGLLPRVIAMVIHIDSHEMWPVNTSFLKAAESMTSMCLSHG